MAVLLIHNGDITNESGLYICKTNSLKLPTAHILYAMSQIFSIHNTDLILKLRQVDLVVVVEFESF